MGTPSKIHVGAGTLTLNPDSSPIDLGYTSEGATLMYNAELEAITVDQVLSPVGYFVPGEECTFETMLSEAAASKLRYALGATDQSVSDSAADASNKGYSEIKFGGNYTLTDYVLEYKAVKRNLANCYIITRLYKVNISPNLEAAYKKDGITYYKMTFKAVADTTQTAGQQLGYYREETADVTGTTATLAVSSTVPADAAAAVVVSVDIEVVFNRNVHPESVISGNFILMTAAGDEVPTTVAFKGDAGTNVTVSPVANMGASTVHILAISQNVRALDDYTPMADEHIINFTTA